VRSFQPASNRVLQPSRVLSRKERRFVDDDDVVVGMEDAKLAGRDDAS